MPNFLIHMNDISSRCQSSFYYIWIGWNLPSASYFVKLTLILQTLPFGCHPIQIYIDINLFFVNESTYFYYSHFIIHFEIHIVYYDYVLTIISQIPLCKIGDKCQIILVFFITYFIYIYMFFYNDSFITYDTVKRKGSN